MFSLTKPKSTIADIKARQILDSRGNPTVECDVILQSGHIGRAAVPAGASTGIHEALALRDGDPAHYGGQGVLKAIESIKTIISPVLVGKDAHDQQAIDQMMISLDGTENKSKLGANAILAVSLASAKAAALAQGKPLYQYSAELARNKEPLTLPLPLCNVINGGKHGDWAIDLQECMILPVGASTFHQALEMSVEVFQTLKSVLKDKEYNIAVGDEGGFAPKFAGGNHEAFEVLLLAIEKAGYKPGSDFVLGIDAAASEFLVNGQYQLKSENRTVDTTGMIDWLANLTQQYPIVSIEDGLEQNDWPGWQQLTSRVGKKTQIVGDDLFVTNTKFIQKGIQEKSANAVLVKVNQIGTLTETIKAVHMTKQAGWRAIISHRSAETEDTTIAHLAVGLSTGQIKTGSLSRTDRVAKYNELLRIEEQLGSAAHYAGKSALAISNYDV